MKNKILAILKRYDFSIFAMVVLIFMVGIANLYSATHGNSDLRIANLYKVQLLWFTLAMFCGLVVSFINPRKLFRYTYFIYGFNIILLLLVLLIGKKSLGAQRWLSFGSFHMQPSEMMKIALVLALGRWYSRTTPDRNLKLRRLIIPALIALPPAILVIMEPDLGTGMLLLLVFMTITAYKGIKKRTVIFLTVLVMISGSLMYQFGLKDYQRKRIVTFINPEQDARGSGYNAIQSKIAIGSGRLFGKGYLKSSQASLQYLPENHTDFVFSIYNEEHGLIGSVFLIVLYLALLMRMIWLSGVTSRFYDSIVTIGVMGIFFWHTLVNMCMVMGLMPIVGLPLPLMSYGGSSLLTFGICAGIITSISNSRNLF